MPSPDEPQTPGHEPLKYISVTILQAKSQVKGLYAALYHSILIYVESGLFPAQELQPSIVSHNAVLNVVAAVPATFASARGLGFGVWGLGFRV